MLNPNYKFFLGGKDLEMVAIRRHLVSRNLPYVNKNLAWGAKASDYRDEIAQAYREGYIPVLIELEPDDNTDKMLGDCVIIDHHNDHSHLPASILQFLDLIDVPAGRHDILVAANDCGYIPEMKKQEATMWEIRMIRQEDREAQGVTAEMEAGADLAISKRMLMGALVVVEIPHVHFSVISDRLFATWPDGKENLLVMGQTGNNDLPWKIAYCGPGHICKAFKEEFMGWGGGKGYGNPDGQGFAGCNINDRGPIMVFFQKYY